MIQSGNTLRAISKCRVNGLAGRLALLRELPAGLDLVGVAPEVLSLRDGGHDGVIGALGVGGNAAQGLARIDRGVGDGLMEVLGSDMVGAGKGDKDAAGLEDLEGAEVNLFVAADGVLHALLGAGEGGRIEDDEVEPAVFFGGDLLEVVEAVGGDEVDLESGGGGILAGLFDGGLTDIDGSDGLGSGEGAGLGKAGLIGEAIEHVAALGESGDVAVVLELVEVEAGFLAFEEVGLKDHAVVANLEGRGRITVKDGFGKFHALGPADGSIVSLNDGGGIEEVLQSLDNEVLSLEHGEGEGLDDEVVAVAIHDEAGKAVGLAPNEAAEGGVDARVGAGLDGALDAALKEVEVQILTAVREEAGGDLRLRVVDGGAKWLAANVFEGDDIAGLWIASAKLDLGGVNPDVTVEKASARLKDECGHVGSSFAR